MDTVLKVYKLTKFGMRTPQGKFCDIFGGGQHITTKVV